MEKKKNGFTLLELMTVMVIIGLLAAMIFPNLGKVRVRARTAKVISELKTIELALMEYYAEYSTFPMKNYPALPVVSSGIDRLVDGKYLDKALKDAFDSNIVYTYYSCNETGPVADSCIVFSIGIDGIENTAADFDTAITDAYTDPMLTDNIYMIIDSRGNEGDIRYKK